MQVVVSITRKSFISEMDLLRLQKALLLARMSANSTRLVDKQPPGFSSKLDRLADLLGSLVAEPERKIILFSEWTSMLDLVEPILKGLGAEFARLDGQVPQKQRNALVQRFQNAPACRCFLTTNAGSTGLNLQAADTVVNIDLPWNPALLEQRIARAHRMGQKRKVQVYLLVTEGTIEENLLATLSAKHELAAAVLDPDSDLREVQLASGMDELKRRLEVLLGAKPEGPRGRGLPRRPQNARGRGGRAAFRRGLRLPWRAHARVARRRSRRGGEDARRTGGMRRNAGGRQRHPESEIEGLRSAHRDGDGAGAAAGPGL
jgi:superfamily II DNA/RNA helicase